MMKCEWHTPVKNLKKSDKIKNYIKRFEDIDICERQNINYGRKYKVLQGISFDENLCSYLIIKPTCKSSFMNNISLIFLYFWCGVQRKILLLSDTWISIKLFQFTNFVMRFFNEIVPSAAKYNG